MNAIVIKHVKVEELPQAWLDRFAQAVSYLEVLQGLRDKAELAAVKKMLARQAATLLPVSPKHYANGH